MARPRTRPTKLRRARELRQRQTPAERYAWRFLRRHRLGFQFRRQHVIVGFIVDFYCPALRLVIEVDGPIHDRHDRWVYDRRRDAVLTGLGLRVIHMRNADVSEVELRRIVEAAKGHSGE